MSEPYLPSKEADLYQWATTFEAFLQATPTAVGLTTAQATAFSSLYANFANAYRAATDPGTRGPATIQTKNDAKVAMIGGPGGIRELVKIIQAFPGTTNTQRVELGVTVPDVEPSPIGVPTMPPLLSIVRTMGRTVTLTLRDLENQDRRAKPAGVDGATILTHVGPSAPTDPSLWTFGFNTTKTTVDVQFPPTLAAGTQVWMTAFWFNERKESGPSAAPQGTTISGAISLAA